MSGLVVGEDPLLLLGDDAPLLEAGDDALHRALEVLHQDRRPLLAAGEDRGLVAEVGQVGAREAGGLARDHREHDLGGERLAARVHQEDLLAALEVGRRDEHLPVEAAGAEERGIEVLEPVRGAHDDHLRTLVEPVELDEQLVQRLVVLAVEAAALPCGADGVELVDEDDRGRVLARLFEQLADPGGAEAGEHLHERRRALRVELRARLAGDRLREQRLARAGRPVEQDPLRNAGAEALEALRVAQEVDDLL